MSSKAALLWDESYLWGLIAYRALKKLSLDFSLITSDEIKHGALDGGRLLYVPGGWASNKFASLGNEGAQKIKEFVKNGGSYIGVCGGAGLATSEGLGLLDIKRRPLNERVPSLSGKIRAKIVSAHPFWNGLKGHSPLFNIWWPSQFKIEDPSIKVIASFDGPSPGAFSSDLNVGSVRDWDALEAEYKLNLNPGRMRGEPLALEGAYGAGRIFLTLIHPDTPNDPNGEGALKNLWEYLGGERSEGKGKEIKKTVFFPGRQNGNGILKRKLLAPVKELFDLGSRNFLWFKDGWIVRWRRGVRGLEYFTLYELVKELARRVGQAPASVEQQVEIESLIPELRGFTEKAGRLLMLERLALQRGEALTFSKASDPDMAVLREKLFSNAKSHGGRFKELLDKVDRVLYGYLKREG
ncbi:MAG: BPL-N domain-containing protein [Nitrospiraceae bacterium]|nr:BPL-N domain-containing protein [Nitrospiraceae bacterium]